MMQCESQNERNVYCLLDANPQVVEFYEQPAEISFLAEGLILRHYPDALIYSKACREFWEIKSASDANRPENVARTELLKAALPMHGFQYRMVVAEDFVCPLQLSTAQIMLKYGRACITVLEREHLRALLVQRRRFTWNDVLAGFLGERTRQYVCRLMLEGTLVWDTQALLPTTWLWFGDTDNTES